MDLGPMNEEGNWNKDVEIDIESTLDSSEMTLLPNPSRVFLQNSTVSRRLVIIGCIGLSLFMVQFVNDEVQSL